MSLFNYNVATSNSVAFFGYPVVNFCKKISNFSPIDLDTNKIHCKGCEKVVQTLFSGTFFINVKITSPKITFPKITFPKKKSTQPFHNLYSGFCLCQGRLAKNLKFFFKNFRIAKKSDRILQEKLLKNLFQKRFY